MAFSILPVTILSLNESGGQDWVTIRVYGLPTMTNLKLCRFRQKKKILIINK